MSTDVNVKIGADISQFQTAMARVKQSTNDTMKSVLEKWANISTGIRNSTRIIQESLSILSAPMQEFAKWEDTATRLAPLVGGLGVAKELASALRDEAANGTMSFEQLASVAGRLATVFSNTEDIRKWTTAFHDLAAGTGMDINELVGNFVRSRASGRFEAGLMDMFAQKGVNIFPELVKQTGQSEVALRKLAAEGKLSFSEVEKAILAVSTGTGQFAGQATAMSNTFGGSISTMIATWRSFLAEIVKPIAEALTPSIQVVGKILAILKDYPAVFSAIAAAVSTAAAAFITFKLSLLAYSAVIALNPAMLGIGATIVALVGLSVAVSSILPETQSLTDKITSSNEQWAQSLKKIKAEYSAIKSLDALDEKRKSDDAAFKDKLEQWLAAHPEFDPQKGKMAFDFINLNRRNTPWFMPESVAEWAQDTSLAKEFVEYEQLMKEKAELAEQSAQREKELLAAEETARLEAAEAASQAAKDEREAIESKIEALEKYREQLLKTRQAEALSGMDARERPDAILANAGFTGGASEAVDQLEAEITLKETELAFAGTAEQAQKLSEDLKELYATQDKLEKAWEAADKRQAQADAAANAARQRIALMKAEISGNRELVKQMQDRERHERIMQELTSKGVDADEAARIATQTVAMENLQAAGTAGRELIGNGLVTSSQASIGGGRSIQVGGESAAVSIARSQLTVMEKIKAAIDAVEKNTAGGFKPALI